MSPPSRHLVFDVGGTQLRAAVYDGETEELVAQARADAPSFARHPEASWADLRARLVLAMSSLRTRVDPRGEARSATVAFAGPLDAHRRVLAGPTLWGSLGVYPYALEDDLREAWPDADIRVINDVTAAGFRYLRGADEDFCVVAVSTGIGNKVFVGGRPLLGPSGQGGEIGHLRVDASADAAPCDWGGGGHVGAMGAGRPVRARARRRAANDEAFQRSSLAGAAHSRAAGELTAESVAGAYREGDAWAGALVLEAAAALGLALAAIHLAIGVDRFVLIGGFALGLGPRFPADVKAAVDARCWKGGPGPVSVALGESDGHCALVGGGRARHLGLLT